MIGAALFFSAPVRSLYCGNSYRDQHLLHDLAAWLLVIGAFDQKDRIVNARRISQQQRVRPTFSEVAGS